jgi:hypothetical protein
MIWTNCVQAWIQQSSDCGSSTGVECPRPYDHGSDGLTVSSSKKIHRLPPPCKSNWKGTRGTWTAGEMTSNECRKRSAAKCSLCSPHAGRTISEQRQSTASGANWPFRPEREPPAVKLNRRKHQHSHGDCRESAANATDDRARQASGCCRLALSLNRRSASAFAYHSALHAGISARDRDGNEVSIRVAPGRALSTFTDFGIG